METLTLPEPAATLWKKIGPRLQDAMREILGGNERWTMTGGTILTARYRHRSSDDIDLHLAPSAADRLVAKRCPHFMASMKELGATGGYQGVRQIVISFPPSELDVWQRTEGDRRHPERSERDARIDGRPEHVESSAQILHGKVKRASRKAPVRDLYDFAVAMEIDRHSLATAINLKPLEETTSLRKKWRDTAQTYANEARAEIKNVPERFAHIQANPADHAAHATENATWTLDRKYYQKKLPVLEAFCEVMSIPDLDQRKKGLQRLEKHPDKWISSNAWAELRKMNQPKPPKKKPTPPAQETQSTD